MSVMTDVVTVAANGTVDNVLAGKVHEFLSEDSIMRLAISAAAIGLHASMLVGAEVLVDDQEVSSSARFPTFADDLLAEGAGFAGDRLILRLRNTTGAGILTKSMLSIEPA